MSAPGSMHQPPTGPTARGQHRHLLILPGSKVQLATQWRQVANRLAEADALIVMPDDDTPICRSMRSLALELRRRGRRVTTIKADHLPRRHLATAQGGR